MSEEEYNAKLEDFAYFVANSIFDEEWEYDATRSFTEIALRKLSKLGIVDDTGDEYRLTMTGKRGEKEND